MRRRRGFVSLLGLVITLLIIGILSVSFIRFYSGTGKQEAGTDETFKKEGIDTSTPSSIVESTRKKVNEINEQLAEKEKQFQNALDSN